MAEQKDPPRTLAETVRRDRPIAIAFINAACAAHILSYPEGQDSTEIARRADWAQLYALDNGTDERACIAPVLGILAPFVRANPEAPPEALYRQAAADKVHAGAAGGWHDLPLPIRFAYGVFQTTLVWADRELKALDQARANAAAAELRRAVRRPLPPDEQTLGETLTGAGDKVDLGAKIS